MTASQPAAQQPMTLDWSAFTAPLPPHAVQQWKAAGHPWASRGIGRTADPNPAWPGPILGYGSDRAAGLLAVASGG